MIASQVRLRRSDIQNKSACPCYESDESEAARFGSLIHAIVAGWTLSAPHTDNVEAMQHAVDLALRVPAGVSADRFGEVRALCTLYAKTHDPNPETLWAVERPFEWENDRLAISGTPDRLDRLSATIALVTDIKTAYAPNEASFTWQCRFYAALLFLNEPELEQVLCRVDHIRLSEDNGITEWTETRDDTLAWWHGEVVPLAESIAARSIEEQQPVGGAACRWCRRRRECPESIAPARTMPTSDAEARECFGELVRLEAGAEERRRELREWYADREPEVVNGEEVGYLRPREPSLRIINTLSAVQLLNERGLTGELLVLDKRQLNKRAKEVLVRHDFAVWETGDAEFKHRVAK